MNATLPPLLALAQGRCVRLRRAPAPRPKEIAPRVAALLRAQCTPQWLWCHYPAGELIRDKDRL